MSEEQNLHVYQAIAAITEALSKEGISKDRKNAQQGYAFRGIDDIYNALAPQLAKNKLCVLPRVLERTCEERQTKSGATLFYVNVKVAFDCISAIDGSKHEIVTLGEAMDSGDKATNKAMSAAYKYAALMAFCIPTEGDNDTENATHEVTPKAKPQVVDKAKLGAATEEFRKRLNACTSKEQVTALVSKNNALLMALHDGMVEAYDDLGREISKHIEAFTLAEAAE